ncbi:MAG: riboflavin synthase [Burkholderiales bacterium]
MFTGIITGLGRISEIIQQERGVRATITCIGFGLDDVAIGDSIACSGACLTVVAKSADSFSLDVSQETLRCTTGLDRLDAEVNLEKALRLSDRLGGHLVSGHIDGVGEVLTFEPVGESWELQLRLPHELEKFVAPKGSIAIDGASLTVNSIHQQIISINIIPHTLAATSFKRLAPGVKVNVEVDLLARYLAQLAKFPG